MFALLWQSSFWEMAGLYALLAYIYRHQCVHAQSTITSRSTLPPAQIAIISLYNALFVNWVFLIYYGYKTVWTHAVMLFIIGSIGAAFLKKAETILKLDHYAWQISVAGILIVPALFALMALRA